MRFFQRVAKGKRLSDRTHGNQDYFVEDLSRVGEALIFYFDKVIRSPLIIPAFPAEFVSELARRWREKYLARMARS